MSTSRKLSVHRAVQRRVHGAAGGALCAILCQAWLLACSDPTPSGEGRTPGGPSAGASGESGGASGTNAAGSGGTQSGRKPPGQGQGPSGCVLEGEVNEFGLPICEPTMDAGRPNLGCRNGFDELGRPVCLGDGGVPEQPPPPSCHRGGLCEQLLVTGGGRLDLLFMVDDSGSMREEQAALVREMPRLIDVLTSGDLDGDGTQDFPAVRDLHIGVVSSDMGTPGITSIVGCNASDEGALQNTPALGVSGCAASYPRFLSYDASQVDPDQAATDFACIATLGTGGCGYEQQLESMLRAVTPSASDRRFLGDPPTGPALLGQADAVNAGFQRSDSLFAFVVVTDEDDCSAREPRLFTPQGELDPADPLFLQDLNLRCYFNPANLFPVERYAAGLQEIRPPGSNLVLFAAIVGVPPELVDEEARSGVDFADADQRDAYYQGILDHDAMQQVIDPGTISPTRNLRPSCTSEGGLAYPPRRIVEVAKRFGANAIVQSICQSSFAPALQLIAERISQSLTVGCLPQTFERDAEGRVACDVVWELPPPGTPGASLQLCEERDYLTTPEDRDQRTAPDGRTRCLVNQVAVRAGDGGALLDPDGQGFYYDDFSSEAREQCGGASEQRVVFTDDVSPPADVRVFVDCEAP